MSFAIVIGSYAGSPWLQECIDSMPKDVDVIVVCERFYECGKIGWAHRHTNLDEFLFLPDTTKLKCHEWIYEMRDFDGSCSVCAEPGLFGSCMGKYRRRILDQIGGVPHTPDKMSAVIAETYFTQRYVEQEPNVKCWFPGFCSIGLDGQPIRVEEKHGRPNAVMENEHLMKWKGAWSAATVGTCEMRDKILTGR